MSYSCSDFATDIETVADNELPELSAEVCEALGVEPDGELRNDSDGLRYNAERVIRAIGDRTALAAALRRYMESDPARLVGGDTPYRQALQAMTDAGIEVPS
jgi:hypothetical protein